MSVTAHVPAGGLGGRALDGGGFLFAGIPFAVPPVGPRRFLPPERLDGWDGCLNATAFRAAPPQNIPAGYDIETSEDCLYLNVWTPSLAGGRPVLAWIHGGGFDVGYAAPPGADPERLMQQGDVVVATIAYRVGALGFLHLEDGNANRGLLDQVVGLQWIRDNIEALGGDPARITAFGNSAGAFSIGDLLGAPDASGLFDRAILQSGTTRAASREQSLSLTRDFVERVGARTADDLAAAPLELMLEIQQAIIDTDIGRRVGPGGRTWGPTLDDRVLPVHPLDAIAAGSAASVPILIGATRDETQLWEILDAENYAPSNSDELAVEMRAAIGDARADALLAHYVAAEPDASLARLRTRFLSDWIFRVPAAQLAEAQTTAGGNAWTFLFGMPSPGLGAHHAAEQAYVFGRLGAEGVAPDTPTARAVSDEMIRVWVSFAASGEAEWPQFDSRRVARFFGEANEPQTLVEPSDEVWDLMRDVPAR